MDEREEFALQKLSMLFSVLGDSGRIRIINTLLNGEYCVSHLAEALGSSQSSVSHQLRILKQNDIVKFRRDGKNIFYSLDDEHIYDIIKLGLKHIGHTLPNMEEDAEE